MPFHSLHRSPRPQQALFGEVPEQANNMHAGSEHVPPSTPPRPQRFSFFRRSIATPVADDPTTRDSVVPSPLRIPRRAHFAGRFHEHILSPAIASVPALVSPEIRQGSTAVDPDEVRRKQKRKRQRQRQRPQAWSRKKADRSVCFGGMKNQAARRKAVLCSISGMALALVLTVYLAVALTVPDVRHEVHILFIIVILCITIFFCHALVRLCMLALNPPRSRNSRARAANGREPESYVPARPIRVFTGSDEELGLRGSPHIGISIDPDEPDLHPDIDPEKEAAAAVKPPPPAYGLWRESVRVDPNLMHWQPVNWSESSQDSPDTATAAPHRRSAPVFSPTAGPPVSTPHLHPEMVEGGIRPPSYVSDDGVRYVGNAAVQARLGVPPAQFVATMSPPRPPPPPRTPVNQIGPSTPVLQFSPMTPVAQMGPVTPVAQMGPVTPVAQTGLAMPMQHQWSPMPASALYSPIPSVQYSPMPPTPPVFSPMPPAQFAATMSPRRPVLRSLVPRVPPVVVTEAPPQTQMQSQPQMTERSSDSSFVTASAGEERTPSFMGDVHPGYRWMVMNGGRGEFS